MVQKVHSSTIEEHNGHKYGIIGTTPIDLYKRSKEGTIQKDITVDNVKETIEDIQTGSKYTSESGNKQNYTTFTSRIYSR